jgi:hypothetical protein
MGSGKASLDSITFAKSVWQAVWVPCLHSFRCLLVSEVHHAYLSERSCARPLAAAQSHLRSPSTSDSQVSQTDIIVRLCHRWW